MGELLAAAPRCWNAATGGWAVVAALASTYRYSRAILKKKPMPRPINPLIGSLRTNLWITGAGIWPRRVLTIYPSRTWRCFCSSQTVRRLFNISSKRQHIIWAALWVVLWLTADDHCLLDPQHCTSSLLRFIFVPTWEYCLSSVFPQAHLALEIPLAIWCG